MGEYFLYLFIGVVVAAILAAVVYVYNKKYVGKLSEVMAKVPKEDLERIKMAQIVPHPEKSNEYTTEGIVVNVTNENNVIKADILFYSNFVGEYAVTKNVICNKMVNVGDFVTTVHKKDKDFGMGKVKEIM